MILSKNEQAPDLPDMRYEALELVSGPLWTQHDVGYRVINADSLVEAILERFAKTVSQKGIKFRPSIINKLPKY